MGDQTVILASGHLKVPLAGHASLSPTLYPLLPSHPGLNPGSRGYPSLMKVFGSRQKFGQDDLHGLRRLLYMIPKSRHKVRYADACRRAPLAAIAIRIHAILFCPLLDDVDQMTSKNNKACSGWRCHRDGAMARRVFCMAYGTAEKVHLRFALGRNE